MNKKILNEFSCSQCGCFHLFLVWIVFVVVAHHIFLAIYIKFIHSQNLENLKRSGDTLKIGCAIKHLVWCGYCIHKENVFIRSTVWWIQCAHSINAIYSYKCEWAVHIKCRCFSDACGATQFSCPFAFCWSLLLTLITFTKRIHLNLDSEMLEKLT